MKEINQDDQKEEQRFADLREAIHDVYAVQEDDVEENGFLEMFEIVKIQNDILKLACLFTDDVYLAKMRERKVLSLLRTGDVFMMKLLYSSSEVFEIGFMSPPYDTIDIDEDYDVECDPYYN